MNHIISSRRMTVAGVIKVWLHAALLVSALWLPARAEAGLILDVDDFVILQGQSVDVSATISLGAGDPGDVWLDSLNITLASLGLTVDDSPFFTNFPALLPSSESITAVLFTATADAFAPLGSSLWSATLFGTAAFAPVESTSDFTVTVKAVPEPGSLLLLISGLTGAAIAWRRRYRQP